MDIMDFNELQEATDEIELALCKVEGVVDPELRAGLDDELVKIVMSLSEAWSKLEHYVYFQGRNPQDIQSGGSYSSSGSPVDLEEK